MKGIFAEVPNRDEGGPVIYEPIQKALRSHFQEACAKFHNDRPNVLAFVAHDPDVSAHVVAQFLYGQHGIQISYDHSLREVGSRTFTDRTHLRAAKRVGRPTHRLAHFADDMNRRVGAAIFFGPNVAAPPEQAAVVFHNPWAYDASCIDVDALRPWTQVSFGDPGNGNPCMLVDGDVPPGWHLG